MKIFHVKKIYLSEALQHFSGFPVSHGDNLFISEEFSSQAIKFKPEVRKKLPFFAFKKPVNCFEKLERNFLNLVVYELGVRFKDFQGEQQ